jgi:hypothetical protein
MVDTTLSVPVEMTPVPRPPQVIAAHPLGRQLVIAAAGIALVLKLAIAWNTMGTNDVVSFYHFGRSLSANGLEATYRHDLAFNHPPLTSDFIRAIYRADHLPWMHDHGVAFPFLLRLPGILADFVVVLVLLNMAKPLRIPTGALLLLALSPVSLMVSGFHGNTDPVMVMFLVLAAATCVWERPTLCGLFLALSCQIKIIPLLLVPVFFFHFLHRRQVISFAFPFAAALCVSWIEPLLKFPAIFAERVLCYGGLWGLWGITYWLEVTGIKSLAFADYYQPQAIQKTIIATGLKLAIVAFVIALAWRRQKLDGRSLFASLGLTWVIFFILSPGVGAQYMVWLMPFVLVLSPVLFLWLTIGSSLFLFFFYNSITGGLPWYVGVSWGKPEVTWLPWSLWPWFVLVFGAGLLWRMAQREQSGLRFWSLASVSPPPSL